MSTDKEAVIAMARRERIPQSSVELVKDPMVLEFLGLEKKPHYYESDLETDDEFFADLVFYNRITRCFVVIELKTGKITHTDLGQLQMYVNYFDRREKLPDENPTVGILLCAEKNDTLVRMSLPQDNKTIVAAKYLECLPTAEQLVKEVESVKRLVNSKSSDHEA